MTRTAGYFSGAFFERSAARQTISVCFMIASSGFAGFGCSGKPLLPKSFDECNSTETCQAQIREREYAFAKAVADEPIAKRIDVETVTRVVMVDVQRQRVYALDPHFVTLDLATGKELRRIEKAAGDSLWRAGSWLVTSMNDSKNVALAFVNPDKPHEGPILCSPKVPMPPEAEYVSVYPFDRAGQVYFYWHSGYSYVGGTPPGEAQLKREKAAEDCGIMRIDVTTCSAQPVPLGDFLWDPPEGRREKPGDKNFCAYLTPLRDFPAARASMPNSVAGYGQFAPASRAPTLVVKSEKGEPNSCRQETRLTLEARDESSALKWSHALAPIVSHCGPP